MSVSRRESYVIHFYHADDGSLSARITDALTQQSWVMQNALQLRMMIAGSVPILQPHRSEAPRSRASKGL